MTRKQWFEKVDNDFNADLSRLRKENRALREAIAAWPEQEHADACDIGQADGCVCGAEKANIARAIARMAARLED